jgi:translation initiation factor IF-2
MAANVFLEGYGGQVSYQGISAKTGEGVDALLDLILLAADMEDLSYDPAATASGYILEARLDPRRGLEASLIVKNGTLHRGDPIETQSAKGKVKILENFLGKVVGSLEPSAPAIVIGFETLPAVGEEFSVAPFAGEREVANGGEGKKIWKADGGKANGKELELIPKASDAGSLEALEAVLAGIGKKDEKGIAVVDESIGDITDSDVKNALATGATIIGFKNRVEKGAQNFAEAQGVTIITSKIVYELADAVLEFLAGKRGPQMAGKLEILAVFNGEKSDKQLVGGRVTEGTIRAKASFDILRKTESGVEGSAGSGRIMSLREKKSELTQAEKGKEVGILANAGAAIKIGDVLVVKK